MAEHDGNCVLTAQNQTTACQEAQVGKASATKTQLRVEIRMCVTSATNRMPSTSSLTHCSKKAGAGSQSILYPAE